MKRTMVAFAVLIALSTQAFAGECADSYLQSGMDIKQNQSFGYMIKGLYDYDETMRFFDQDKWVAVTTLAVLGVGFPLILIVDGATSAVAAHEARYLLQVGEALSGADSKTAKKGFKRMHRLVSSEINISLNEFQNVLTSLSRGEALCQSDQKIGLSEKGRERVGDAGFFAYLNRINGTPEWDEFWNDRDNFQMTWGLVPLKNSELKRALVHALVSEGYARR